METVTCRLLPFAVNDGPTNMAIDEVLLQAATRGQASLRFYGWSRPTLSLGYFQPSSIREQSPFSTFSWLRRPTGGSTLIHQHELTYALAVPMGSPFASESKWMPRMHGIIAGALSELGVVCELSREEVDSSPLVVASPLCFLQPTQGDVMCFGCKIVGSAQRKHRHALLQHGAILLEASEYAPELPGIKELTGTTLSAPALVEAIVGHFLLLTGWKLVPGGFSDEEITSIVALSRAKYVSATWNSKR